MTTIFLSPPEIHDSLIHYGDGLFETMLAINGAIINFDYHYARLLNGCKRLEIACPQVDQIQSHVKKIADNETSPDSTPQAVKLILSRGKALRGYRTLAKTDSFAYLAISDYQVPAITPRTLTISEIRLSKQPVLAGLKHTNRLEQILAKRKLSNADEAIMMDSDESVIECIAHNIFWRNEMGWHTPALELSGVAGTMRAQILDCAQKQGIPINVETYTIADLKSAKNVFITNAVAGIVPVGQIVEPNNPTTQFSFDKLAVYSLCRHVNHPCLNFYSDSL